eukprot:3600990-Pyramimonas_sp.AAC.1
MGRAWVPPLGGGIVAARFLNEDFTVTRYDCNSSLVISPVSTPVRLHAGNKNAAILAAVGQLGCLKPSAP